jgi:hypothetical protein
LLVGSIVGIADADTAPEARVECYADPSQTASWNWIDTQVPCEAVSPEQRQGRTDARIENADGKKQHE